MADRRTATTARPRLEAMKVRCVVMRGGVCPNAKKIEPNRPLRYVLPGACTLAPAKTALSFQRASENRYDPLRPRIIAGMSIAARLTANRCPSPDRPEMPNGVHKCQAVHWHDEGFQKLMGIVKVDETFVGGRAKNRHKDIGI